MAEEEHGLVFDLFIRGGKW